MFKIIRAGTAYGVVVAVTPADAKLSTVGAKYFERKTWDTEKRPANQFYEISLLDAELAFCGQADGWGFAEIPSKSFSSLEEIEAFILEEQSKI